MNKADQLRAWTQLGGELELLINQSGESKWREKYNDTLRLAEASNPWFTAQQLETAFRGIVKILNPDSLQAWFNHYPQAASSTKKTGVIMAGNIPMAGFHDFLCVLLSGQHFYGKLSSSDKYLIPFVAEILVDFEPLMKDNIHFVEQLKEMDAIIATGSNNTSRYFEYYFGKKPHIFRKNRNSAAIITGTENEFDIMLLGKDIFTYFGLGCRSVSKLYVPDGFDFDYFFRNIISFEYVLQHSKYMNNFDYHQSLYLLNRQPFLTNNFIILTEEKSLASPVGVLHYEYYSNEEDLQMKLKMVKDELQCVVRKNSEVGPGQAQSPSVNDYADGVDTLDFLLKI